MTDEPFLARWSRLKREPDATPLPVAETAAPEPTEPAPAQPAAEPPALPPLEDLGAGSDYTAFLRDGVPAELRRLALRKAWTSDPKIAEFRGFADYDWDYNAPGYGALLPTDDIAGLLDRFFPPEDPPPSEPPPEEPVVAAADPDPVPDDPALSDDPAARM